MKNFLLLVLFCNVLMSCSVVETIEILDDGNGTMTITELQDFKKIKYALPKFPLKKSDVVIDEMFSDVLFRNAELVCRMSKVEQDIYKSYAKVRVQIQNDSTQQTGEEIISSKFSNIEELPNLYNAAGFRGNIISNHAISVKQKGGVLNFFYDRKVFKRVVKIIDTAYYSEEKFFDRLYNNELKDVAYTANYTLAYKFPKKIKSVSNDRAVISADKKQISIVFALIDVRRNPEITNLEIVFEE